MSKTQRVERRALAAGAVVEAIRKGLEDGQVLLATFVVGYDVVLVWEEDARARNAHRRMRDKALEELVTQEQAEIARRVTLAEEAAEARKTYLAAKAERVEKYGEVLARDVGDMDLSPRAVNCMWNAGIDYVWQLVERSEDDLLKTKAFGRKALNNVKEALSEMGLSLKKA